MADNDNPEFTHVLVKHKDVSREFPNCEGTFGQTIMGPPKCSDCGTRVRPEDMTPPTAGSQYIWVLALSTDNVLVDMFNKMEEQRGSTNEATGQEGGRTEASSVGQAEGAVAQAAAEE